MEGIENKNGVNMINKEMREGIYGILEDFEDNYSTKDEALNDILEVLKQLGYHKLPEDEPPLLKYQCSHAITAGSYEWHNIEGYNQGTQAQRKADIKFYADRC